MSPVGNDLCWVQSLRWATYPMDTYLPAPNRRLALQGWLLEQVCHIDQDEVDAVTFALHIQLA